MADFRESERQLRLVTENVRVGIAHCDNEGRYTFVNRHYAEWHGVTPEQVVGKLVPEVVGQKTWAIAQSYFHECLAGKTIEFDFEADLRCRPSEPQFMHCCYEPEWRDGKVIGLIAAITNITSVKRTEAALRESETTFRAMFDVSSVGHIEVEPESGRFLRANAAVCRLLGYAEAELLGLTIFDTTHPDDRYRAQELLRRMIAGESAESDLEKRSLRKDGSAVWTRVTVNVVRDASGRPLRNIAVIQDINARKQAEQALHTSKERLQFALDAARLGWGQYDPIHGISWWDTRLKEMFEIAEDKTAIEEFTKRVHPDDVERVWAAIEATLDPIDPKPCAIEFRHLRADGEVRWAEAHGLAHFEGVPPERRAVMMVGTVQDITVRKRREAEREEREDRERLLMREVNHRAKNMLSVVQAIARQTAVRRPKHFIERFAERLQALSANQDLLIKNEWKGVDVKDLVLAQLAHFADLVGSRITLHGSSLRLNAAAAQAIGLALHELATNAGKYGALSSEAGGVDVRWGTDGDTFTMNWSERGGPPVSAPKRRGFGSTVIETMTERTVDGTVGLDYAPSGVTWRLTCRAANALER